MKLPTVILSFVLFFAIAGTSKAQDDGMPDVLGSDKCGKFMKEMIAVLEDTAKYSDWTITSLVCNPIQRKLAKKKKEQIKKDLASGAISDPCERAYKAKLMKKEKLINAALRNSKKCKKQATTEVGKLKKLVAKVSGAIDRSTKKGNDDGGRRELWWDSFASGFKEGFMDVVNAVGPFVPFVCA